MTTKKEEQEAQEIVRQQVSGKNVPHCHTCGAFDPRIVQSCDRRDCAWG